MQAIIDTILCSLSAELLQINLFANFIQQKLEQESQQCGLNIVNSISNIVENQNDKQKFALSSYLSRRPLTVLFWKYLQTDNQPFCKLHPLKIQC